MTKTCKNCGHSKYRHKFGSENCCFDEPDCSCKKFEAKNHIPQTKPYRVTKSQAPDEITKHQADGSLSRKSGGDNRKADPSLLSLRVRDKTEDKPDVSPVSVPRHSGSDFCLSDKMSKDKEDIRDGAYVFTQKHIKEFIRRLKEGLNLHSELERFIDKLAGKELSG